VTHRLVLAALLLLVVGAGCIEAIPFDGQRTTYNATVTGVVDGDTVDVRLADGTTDRVRLLGVDTPEVHVAVNPGEYPGVPNTTAARACLRGVGENASDYVRRTVDGRAVRLELDPRADRRGGYDRLLAYLSVEQRHLNRELLDRGYARVYETSFSRRESFREAAETARAANRGVWRCRT